MLVLAKRQDVFMAQGKLVSNPETGGDVEQAIARVYASLKHLLVLQLLKRKWQLAFWAGALFLITSLWLCAVMLLSLSLAGLTQP